jgi:flagellar basal body-associated protein FliL
MKKLIIIGVAAILLLGGGGAAAYFLLLAPHAKTATAAKAPPPKPKPLLFADISDLVASIPPDTGQPASSYLSMSIQFATTDAAAPAAFTGIAPIAKAAIISLMLAQTAKTITDPAARQALAAASLKAVNQALTQNAGYTPANPFTAAYITNLVVQN